MLFKLSKFIDQLLTKVEHIYKTTTNSFNPLECNGNYSATSNNMKLVQVNQAAARPGPSSIRSVARGGVRWVRTHPLARPKWSALLSTYNYHRITTRAIITTNS